MNNIVKTMIRVKGTTKEGLDAIKLIPEEPYDKVVWRLLTFFKEHEGKKKEEPL